jgi:hypothetical protein
VIDLTLRQALHGQISSIHIVSKKILYP